VRLWGLCVDELSGPLREVPAAQKDAVRVYVQIDAPTGISKRFRLTADKPEPLGVFPTRPSRTLSDFVDDVRERHPRAAGGGPRTALVVWGHASGSGRGTGRAHVSVGASVGIPKGPYNGARNDATSGAEVAQAGSVWAQLAIESPKA